MIARYTVWGRVAPAALVILVAACAPPREGGQPRAQAPSQSPGQSSSQAPAPGGDEAGLAPETFDKTGLAIWDGGATLQGVWVAHPLAERAQRVQVINLDNGRIVQGAMFRRDPTISGPSILVSSDAAAALALQPGRPTKLRLTALKEGVYASPAPAPESAVPAAEAPNASDAATSDIETAALAAPEPSAAPQSGNTTEAAPDALPETAGEAEASANTPAPPETPAEAPVSATSEEQPTARAATRKPAPFAKADDASATPQAEPAPAPVPALETNVTETAITPPPMEEQVVESAPPAPQPARKKVAVASVSPFQGVLPAGGYVQAGAFGIEYNARALVARMRNEGYPAEYVMRPIGGNMLNVVMIGPLADDAATDAALAAAVRAGAAGARKVTR